jgi:STE24 endopeptidase
VKDIHPLLDEESQKKARLYEKEKRLFGFASLFLSLAFLLILYFSGISSSLAGLDIAHSIIGTIVVYVVTFYSAMTMLGLPLDFVSGYVHEHKWGFSNHTVKTWLWDKIKSFLIGLIIFILILGLLLWIMAILPEWWWLATALAMAVVSVFFAIIFPVVIAPVFNKYTPIQNEELTRALDKIIACGGLKSSGIFKEDMSRQTKKENAFLAGLGKTRRIVLGDNLLENMTIGEIESIIAHEVGHYKYRHIWKNIGIGTLQQLLIFFVINWILIRAFPDFLTSTQDNLSLFPVFAVLMGGFSGFLFAPLNHSLSRYFEKQADRYALASIQNNRSFITALAGLANRNLSNAYPEWWAKLLYYSHPPIGERLEMAEKRAKAEEKPQNPHS